MEKDINVSHKGQGAATNREKGQGVTRTRAGAATCKNGLARTLVKVKVFIQVKDWHNLHIYIGKSLTQVRSWSNYLYRLKVVIIFIHIQVKGCHNLHTYTVLPRSNAPPPHFIANLVYRQNSRLSRFLPLKIPRYTAKLRYHHRHRFSDTKVVKPI